MTLWIKLITNFIRPVFFTTYLDIPKIQASNVVFSYASNAVLRNSHAKYFIMTKNKGHFAELKLFGSLNHNNLSSIPFSPIFFPYVSIKYLFGTLNITVPNAQVFYVLWLESHMWSNQKIKAYLGTKHKFFLKTKLSNLRFF